MVDSNKFLQGVLDENRESLKWLWLIVMAFSMESAVNTFYRAFIELSAQTDIPLLAAITLPPSNGSSFLVLLVTGLLFLFTFSRYVVGGSRYIDLRFMEMNLVIESGDVALVDRELPKFSGWRSFCDVILLIIHGILFLFLANAIGNFNYFVQTYIFILIINITWLCISLLPVSGSGATEQGKSTFDSLREEVGLLKRDTAPWCWLVINLSTLILLEVVRGMESWRSDDQFIYACMSIILLNTVADFGATWRFYFPSFRRKRKQEGYDAGLGDQGGQVSQPKDSGPDRS